MSVINQMLRDLDARQTVTAAPASRAATAQATGLPAARIAWGIASLLGVVVVALLANGLADRPAATMPLSMEPPTPRPASAATPQPVLEEPARPVTADAPVADAAVLEPAASLAPAPVTPAPAVRDQEVGGVATQRAAPSQSAPARPEPVQARIEPVEVAPTPADTPLVLARAALAAGNAHGAMVQLEAADAGNPEVWALRASAEQQLGRPAAAVSAWTRALAGRPDVAAWWAGLGIALEASGQAVEARAAFEQAQAHDAGDAALASYVAQRLDALRPESTE